MKPKVILHIGQSKTGTSAIQSFLTLSSKQLREKGIVYPMVTNHGMPLALGSHNAMADALLGVSTYPFLSAEEYFSQFWREAEKKKSHTMILSAEHLFGGQPRLWDISSVSEYWERYEEKAYRLSELLAGAQVELFAHLRPQIDWLSSTISHTIKIEQLASHKKIYQSDDQFFNMIKPSLDYNRIISIWADQVRAEKVTISPYIKKSMIGGNSVVDFLTRTGINTDLFPEQRMHRKINESITREYIEVKKRLNEIRRDKDDERLVVHCLKRLSRNSVLGTYYKIEESVVNDAKVYCDAINKELVKNFLPGEQFSALSEYRGDDQEALSQAIIDQAMDNFMAEYGTVRSKIWRTKSRVKSTLRTRARPVHSALHQLKRLYRVASRM
jgi:hypothetical protein